VRVQPAAVCFSQAIGMRQQPTDLAPHGEIQPISPHLRIPTDALAASRARAPHAPLGRGADRAGQEAKGLEPWSPRAGVDSTLGPPRALRPRWRIDQEHRHAPGLQALTPRAPLDPGRFQGDGRDPARGQPVGHARDVDRVRATAAHRLGIVTGGHRPLRRFGPHVETRRVPVDGGQWGGRAGWERGCCGWRWALVASVIPGDTASGSGGGRGGVDVLFHTASGQGLSPLGSPRAPGTTRITGHPAPWPRRPPTAHGHGLSRPPSAPQFLAVAQPRSGITTLIRVRPPLGSRTLGNGS
jgi:hypothetical protein